MQVFISNAGILTLETRLASGRGPRRHEARATALTE